MKKFCKVKLKKSICNKCQKEQLELLQFTMGFWHNSTFKDCRCCDMQNQEYELVKIGTGPFPVGDYAMVQRDGRVFRVPLDEVYAIREVPDETKNM